jgi:hypothetical protein
MLKAVENTRDFFKDSRDADIPKILDELELKLNRGHF